MKISRQQQFSEIILHNITNKQSSIINYKERLTNGLITTNQFFQKQNIAISEQF